MLHVPVLKKEVLEYLRAKSNENFIDCTIGAGGHTRAILEKNRPKGRVLGIEIDTKLYQKLKPEIKKASNRLVLINDSFANLKKIVKKENFGPVSGILFDLGMSSWHLEKSKRGFSFLKNEELDMRYGNKRDDDLRADNILNKYSQRDIENILKDYGEERFAKRISRKIVEKRGQRPIKNTFQLVEIIRKAVPDWYRKRKIHFATKTFQALRIVVNNELNNLKQALPQAIRILRPEGRIVVISFHSLEDRIVKNFFREQSKKGLLEIITKKVIKPKKEEIQSNPRSRSAKLRAAIKSASNI